MNGQALPIDIPRFIRYRPDSKINRGIVMPARITRELFIKRSHQAHGDRYDYSQTFYTNNTTRVAIVCPQHGLFYQAPNHHMDGVGCPKCAGEASAQRQAHHIDQFIEQARSIHGDRYDYSKSVYQRSDIKVEIVCPNHGSFWQLPNNHINKRTGCPKCAGKFLSTHEFITKARQVHGDRFSYNQTDYQTIKGHITITCPEHGPFTQPAESHLAGNGCLQCWKEHHQSREENRIAEWIESLGVTVERQAKGILSHRMEIDIYIPDLKLGIEYNGCYWHSDHIEGERRRTADKHEAARSAGVTLITVWEPDWLSRTEIVKRHIAHRIGKDNTPRIHARACTVDEWPAAEANRFYEENHLQGPCRGSGPHLVLRYNGQPVASMSFGRGSARRGRHDWELIRYATSAQVRGGASRLFARFVALHQPQTVWSFSDKQTFSGELYPVLKFANDGPVTTDYRIVNPKTMRVWHKSAWQRRYIPARLQELGSQDSFDPNTDPRTERQMQDLAKVVRIWDAGKTRWRWNRPTTLRTDS